MCYHKIICLWLFAAAITVTSAQDVNTNILDSFSAELITNIRAGVKEHAYLITDKSVYKAGEYVWFNVLLLNTRSQKLSNKSKFLYVDIVNENDNIIKRLIMDAGSKLLYSRIQLPDSLTGGYYWLRAYTRQMAAQDTGNIAVQPMYVLDKTNNFHAAKQEVKNSSSSDAPVITFYPEGGNMITGINAVVGMTASDKNGVPLHIEGVIKDSRDSVTTAFITNANGLGKFEFEPSGFRHYKAVINSNGKECSYPLPGFNFRKGQLAVTKQPGYYSLRVLLGDSIYKKTAVTYVAGISKDSLVFAAFGKGLYQVNIDENKLPPGITTFYLFDTAFNLLSERSVYVNNNNVQVKIATDKSSYARRDKVNLSVSVTDASGQAIPSLISLSVSDSLSVYKQPCAFAAMADVLNVDNLFFATHNCFSEEEKDILMLTKNNSYATLTQPVRKPAAAANDSLFYVSGKVLNTKNEEAAKIVTLISSEGSNGLYYTDTTDNSGRFRFALNSYPDSLQYALQVKDFNNHTLTNSVQTDPFDFPRLRTPDALKSHFSASLKPAVERLQRQYDPELADDAVHHLPLVTVKDEKETDYDISKRVSSTSAILSGKDFDGRTSVDNLILKVSGLQLINGFLVMRGLFSMSGPGANTEPLVIADGMPVSLSANAGVGNISPVLSYLSTLNPKDIDFIEVLKDGNAANYGVRGANGIILINTTNKVRNFNQKASNMKVFYAEGITKPALFSNRVYDQKDKKAAQSYDARTTLLWNGNFLTGKQGNAAFTLYSSDVAAIYTVTITGITRYGDIIYKTISFRNK